MTVHSAPTGFGETIAPDTVRFERLLPGPLERVWSFVVDPAKRALWLAGGDPIVPEVGSTFRLAFHNALLSPEPVPERFRDKSGPIETTHRVVRCEPPHTLGFTWDVCAENSEVLIALAPAGDRVRLTLTHTRVGGEGKLSVSGGWHSHLALLEAEVAGTPRPAFWALLASVDEAYRRAAG